MKKIIVLLASAALLAACGDVSNPAAAVVEGETISKDEVQSSLERFVASPQFEQLGNEQDPESVKRQYEQSFLTRLIRRTVLEKAAAESGVEVTDSDVTERLDQLKQDFESEEAFLAEVERQGTTIEEVEGFVRDSLLEEALRAEVSKDVGPTEEEIQEFYDANVDRFTEIHTAHILVETNREAVGIRDQLDAASPGDVEELFAELANEHSLDTGSGRNGGDLGFVDPTTLVPEYSQAAADLELGEISNPVRSQFGFHIIRMIDRRIRPLTDVQEQITQQLTGEAGEQAWQEFIQQAYQDADIEVNSRYGELDLETQTIVNANAESVPGGEPPPEQPTPNPDEAPEPVG
jgi:foldase protein PrsA